MAGKKIDRKKMDGMKKIWKKDRGKEDGQKEERNR